MSPIPTKKQMLSSQAYTEPVSEPAQSSSVVVIHPGSMFLRIGRSSDPFPHSVPHVIARRRLYGSPSHEDHYLVPTTKMNYDTSQTVEETCLVVKKLLSTCLTSEGDSRYTVSSDVIREYNHQVKPVSLPNALGQYYVKPEPNQDFIVGEEVLHLNPNEKMNIHWPMRRGQLNVHKGPSGSITSVIADLEAIWMTVMKNILDISTRDIKNYRVVLVIPDVYNRQHIKEIVNMLLITMGFSACFIHLESVCATFGAGLSFACVVDVGDQKTSVSCVEDGISHRNTRLCMEFGGGDVTQFFYWLLLTNGFPYKTCNPKIRTDAILLQELKENFCHVNLDLCGAYNRSFVVKQPGKPVLQFPIKVGEESLVGPLSLFHPEMLGMTGMKNTRTMKRNEGDPEDPHDDNYLIQTQRRGVKETTDGAQTSDLNSQMEDGQLNQGVLDDDIDTSESASTVRENDRDLQCDQLLGIDQAVLHSIDRCDSDDLRRKMYGCILLIGGGIMFPGIHTWLKNRLSVQIPIMYRSEQLDIITRPKDMDARVTTWKGAAVMSCLDTAQELWIRQREWHRFGVRMLRERAPFTW